LSEDKQHHDDDNDDLGLTPEERIEFEKKMNSNHNSIVEVIVAAALVLSLNGVASGQFDVPPPPASSTTDSSSYY
jgi:hypothetical protein